MIKRKFIPISKALQQAREIYGFPENYGICACYDIENMGYLKDNRTRWYLFTDVYGEPAYTLKH